MKTNFFSKSFLISLLLITFGINTLNAQTNLEIANKYYNEDNYSKAIDYFKKSIFEDNQYDGTIFYRYAYSLEQNKLSESEYSPYYEAAAYLFEKNKDVENKYYSYAIAKEKKLNISHKHFSDKTIEQLLNGKKIQTKDFMQSTVAYVDDFLKQFTENITSEVVIVYAIIIIIIYIIGRIFSKKTECVILSSIQEILLLYTPCLLIIAILFLSMLSISLSETTTAFLFIIALCISFISAIAFSIYENLKTKKPVLYITVSIITKLALFILAPIVLYLSTAAMKTSEKDRRYRDGTKNNQKTRNIVIAISVISGLIFSLIKTPKHKIEEDVADW